jgi:hypothetical protein
MWKWNSLIGFKEASDLVAGGKALQLAMQCLEPGDLLRPCSCRRFEGAASLEHRHQGKDLVQILVRDLGDEGPAAWPQGDQPFGGEHLQRFTQWRPADAILDRQLLFVDADSGQQFVRKNPLSQPLGDFLVEGRLRYPTRRHGCSSSYGESGFRKLAFIIMDTVLFDGRGVKSSNRLR